MRPRPWRMMWRASETAAHADFRPMGPSATANKLQHGSFLSWSSRRPLHHCHYHRALPPNLLPRLHGGNVHRPFSGPRQLRHGSSGPSLLYRDGSCGMIGSRCLTWPRTAANGGSSWSTVASHFSSIPATTTTPTSSLVTSRDGVTGTPIDFDVAAKIEGHESQMVTITLAPGQVLRAETGALLYMTTGVEMNTTTGGGLSAGMQRWLTGQHFFIADYTYSGPTGTTGQVALGTDFPSKILRLNVAEYGGQVICQKGALLCASHTIDISVVWSKNFATGFFGAEGFILQGLSGPGEVFLKAGGTLIRRELKKGEVLRVSSGCLVAFSKGVDYDVQMVRGFTNILAGGEGLFITTLTGPGVVWLQGQPADRLIREIARRVPSGGVGLAVPLGGGGSGGESSGEGGSGEGGGAAPASQS